MTSNINNINIKLDITLNRIKEHVSKIDRLLVELFLVNSSIIYCNSHVII